MAAVDDLTDQTESGFYDTPAPVWQGDVQPRAVVYVSKPGELARMPASVRNLRAVRDLQPAFGSSLNAATLIVIDTGIVRVFPSSAAAARVRARKHAASKRRRVMARAADKAQCTDKYFCTWDDTGWTGFINRWYGPTYYGLGWVNYSPAQGASMVNNRDGDSLLADGYNGTGDRYCAHEQSEDSTFSGNAIGINRANSVALLGSNVNRC